MTLDRTKPPPIAVGEPHTFDHSMSGHTWQLYLHDNSGHAGVFGDSPEDCIRIAWAEYDRITLPARVALLRELAASMRSGDAGFREEKSALPCVDVEAIDEWADDLEKSG